jgi:thioredoxin 1
MNKNFIYVIIGVIMIMVVAATFMLAQETKEDQSEKGPVAYEEVNEAGKLSEGMVGITSENYDEVTSEGVVVVDVFAPSCSYCVRYTPIFAEVFEEYKDKATFGKIDATKNSQIIAPLNISGTPETIIFKDGEIANRIGGFVEADRLKAEIDKVLAE